MSLEIDGNDTVGLTRRFDTLVVFFYCFIVGLTVALYFPIRLFRRKSRIFLAVVLSALPDGISRRCLLCENQNDASAAR